MELVACDDGSSDETVSILRSYAETAPFPVRIYENEKNLGYADNFLKAASLCHGDWVAFCDQDDVWFSWKLADVVQTISQHPHVIIVLQNAYLSNADLTARGRVIPDNPRMGQYGARALYWDWRWAGFLQTVNADIFRYIESDQRPIIPNLNKRHSHDVWTCLIANILGGIIVLKNPVALYRRHDKTVTGNNRPITPFTRILKALSVDVNFFEDQSAKAKRFSIYCEALSKDCEKFEWRKEFRSAAEELSICSMIQNTRADLYKNKYIFQRFRCFFRIFLLGGYVGPRFKVMGLVSAAKDLARMFGIISAVKY